jgi:hypothetical protein
MARDGSPPIKGNYITWRYPNWAAKLSADALMMQLCPDLDDLG